MAAAKAAEPKQGKRLIAVLEQLGGDYPGPRIELLKRLHDEADTLGRIEAWVGLRQVGIKAPHFGLVSEPESSSELAPVPFVLAQLARREAPPDLWSFMDPLAIGRQQ